MTEENTTYKSSELKAMANALAQESKYASKIKDICWGITVRNNGRTLLNVSWVEILSHELTRTREASIAI